MDKGQTDALVGNLKKLGTEGKYAGQINVLESDHLQVAPNLYNQYKRETTPAGQTPMQFNSKNPIDVRGEDSIKAFGNWMKETVEKDKQKGGTPRAETMEPDAPIFLRLTARQSLRLIAATSRRLLLLLAQRLI